MRDSLIILLPVNSNRPLLWAVWSGSEIIENGVLDISASEQLAEKGLPATLILPGQNIRSYEHQLPKMSRKERAKAVLFAIEDKVSSSLDKLHVALKEHLSEGADPINTVSVIDRDSMTEIKDWANSIGLDLRHIISDFEVLDGFEHDVVALDDRVITPGLMGHTQDRDWHQGHAEPLDVLTFFRFIAPRVPEATNLMQGEFTPKSTLKGQTKNWLQFGALAACLGLAVLIFQMSEARAIKAQAQDIRAQTAALYAERTGQPAPINPARAVAQSTRKGQITPTQFLTLSQISFRALEDFNDVSIERVSYQNNRDELQLRLVYPSFERADDVQKAMAAAGGQFIPGGVREQGGRFVGEAVLKMGGAG